MSNQITTITFFKYESLSSKLWAFKMMQFAHKPMSQLEGLQFYKLMGSGKGLGFNPWPDWTTYAILQIWDSEYYAEEYFQGELHNKYRQVANESWTIYMRNIQAQGTWSGNNPFEVASELLPDQKLAIITRATIKSSELYHFWKYVPNSEQGLMNNEGLLFTKGIGEAPFVQMATFSIWKDFESLKSFAYQQKGHQKAIQLTRSRDWYSEELFSRFHPYRFEGTWEEQNWFKQPELQ